jgi:hypothetical protein
MGTFEPTGYLVDQATGEHVPNYNGPWNFSSTFYGGPIFDGITTPMKNMPITYFHLPFPELSRQAYTAHPTCIIPVYPGVENAYEPGFEYEYLKDSIWENVLQYAYEVALRNADVGYQGYGPYPLCNKDPSELGFVPDSYGFHWPKDHNFHPSAGTDFVSGCSQTYPNPFTTEMQNDLYSNGGYVALHVYAGFNSIYDESQGVVVKTAHRTVGMTPMYPKSYWDQHNLPPMSEGTFFGIPRCDFYETQMSKEAYEFVYSHENCHPCDGFKFNTPFHCEKQVRKTAGEIIGLSVSNTLALFGLLVAVGPALIRALKIGEGSEETERAVNENEIRQ